ncbi:MAG: hypothetical protein JNM09_29785, partial [Blastocatellia bacterium]|nr:hypothetical protein [Blastocatellia bacterium]
ASQFHRTQRHSLLHCFALLVITLCTSVAAFAQTQLNGVCPTTCGIKIKIASATLTEANDGMIANIEWSVEQSAPEIQLENFEVFARVKLGLDNVENTARTSAGVRKVTIKLSRRLEFDLKDVEFFTAKVTAFAKAIPDIAITDIPSRKIVGEGRDSAVEVQWNTPFKLPCSANVFSVDVSAKNEKNDKLNGLATVNSQTRQATVELKGDVNKKGLHDPRATVTLKNSNIECGDIKSTSSPIATVPRDNSGQAKVTLKNVAFVDDSGRIDITPAWDAVVPDGFKLNKFDVKFEKEAPDGTITVNTRTVNANDRTTFEQVGAGTIKLVTVTVIATFRDNANTQIFTREDRRTQGTSLKQAPVRPVQSAQSAKTSLPAPSVAPQTPNLNLSTEIAKIVSESNAHTVTVKFLAKPPSGINVTTFVVEATAIGNQKTLTRSASGSGQTNTIGLQFPFGELGDKLKKVQVKVTATAQRANGSVFQQTATAEGQPVTPPPPPPPPPVQLKVNALSSNNGGLFVNGGWFIEVQPGITLQGFLVEVTILKPSNPVRKAANVGATVRQQGFSFATKELNGATGVEMKVTATLRRADGATFQETSTRHTKP